MIRKLPPYFLALFLVLIPSAKDAASAIALSQPESRYFPETGHTVSGKFLLYWQQHGGLAQQGYPLSDELQERSDTDGKTYTTQYFERAVFEAHPENQPPYDVLLSLLGDFQYKLKYPGGAPSQTPNTSSGSVLFSETGKRLGGIFLQYWQTHGGLMQQGYPISDELTEVSDLNGKIYTVQYFERAIFEYHPENSPPYNVLLSQLGKFQYDRRHQSTATPTATPTAAPVATPPAEAVAWLRSNAIPFNSSQPSNDYTDLQPLKTIIGNARIVSLGESTHGTHEFFQMKDRILEFLVNEMGFSVFAIEDNWAEADLVNSYVQTGSGSAEQAISNLFRFPWQTQEMLEMIKWMRTHNLNPSGAPVVSFEGFDMQAPALPMNSVIAYLQKVDAQSVEPVRSLYACFQPYVNDAHGYASPPQSTKAQCHQNVQSAYDQISAHQSTYEAASSPQEFAPLFTQCPYRCAGRG